MASSISTEDSGSDTIGSLGYHAATDGDEDTPAVDGSGVCGCGDCSHCCASTEGKHTPKNEEGPIVAYFWHEYSLRHDDYDVEDDKWHESDGSLDTIISFGELEEEGDVENGDEEGGSCGGGADE